MTYYPLTGAKRCPECDGHCPNCGGRPDVTPECYPGRRHAAPITHAEHVAQARAIRAGRGDPFAARRGAVSE